MSITQENYKKTVDDLVERHKNEFSFLVALYHFVAVTHELLVAVRTQLIPKPHLLSEEQYSAFLNETRKEQSLLLDELQHRDKGFFLDFGNAEEDAVQLQLLISWALMEEVDDVLAYSFIQGIKKSIAQTIKSNPITKEKLDEVVKRMNERRQNNSGE